MNTGTRERGRVAPVPRVQQHAFVRGPLKTRWFYLANPAGSWHSRGGLDREVCTAGVAILVTIPLRHRSHSNHLDSKSKTSPHEFSIRLSTRCIFFFSFLSLSLSLREYAWCVSADDSRRSFDGDREKDETRRTCHGGETIGMGRADSGNEPSVRFLLIRSTSRTDRFTDNETLG